MAFSLETFGMLPMPKTPKLERECHATVRQPMIWPEARCRSRVRIATARDFVLANLYSERLSIAT